jgi:putative hydrolase of the HAD superfamily
VAVEGQRQQEADAPHRTLEIAGIGRDERRLQMSTVTKPGQQRVVLFDLVGTLVRIRGTVGAQYARLAEQSGLDLDAAAVDEVFPYVLARSPFPPLAGVRPADIPGREKGYWRRLAAEVAERAGARWTRDARFESWFDLLFDHFATAEAWQVYPDVLPALRQLHELRCRIGLLTNYDTRVFGLLSSLGLQSFFEAVTLPATAGTGKPDPEIFRHALRSLGERAENAAYVGDSVEEDVLPAMAAGLRAVLLDRGERHDRPPGAARIVSLAGLEQAFGTCR